MDVVGTRLVTRGLGTPGCRGSNGPLADQVQGAASVLDGVTQKGFELLFIDRLGNKIVHAGTYATRPGLR